MCPSNAHVGKPLRAALFCELSEWSAFQIGSWLDAGHVVVAYIVPKHHLGGRRRHDWWHQFTAPRWSLAWQMRRAKAEFIVAPANLSDPAFLETMRRLQADVLISLGFGRKLPDALRQQFRFGGVNVHPALLPMYRGPHPVPAMAMDNSIKEFGGVTLHVLADEFDAGDIIAQQPAGERLNTKLEFHSIINAEVGAALIAEALPRYCNGEIRAMPQMSGAQRYARLSKKDIEINGDMTVDDITRRVQVFGYSGGVTLEADGKSLVVTSVLRVSNERSSRPICIKYFSVEFDAFDGRIQLLRENRFARRYRRLRAIWEMRSVGNPN